MLHLQHFFHECKYKKVNPYKKMWIGYWDHLISTMAKLLILLCLTLSALEGLNAQKNSKRPAKPLDGKIVGGYSVGSTYLPQIVSIFDRSGHFCGGTVIGKRHVLTAAHCFDSPSRLWVRQGSHNHSGGKTYAVRRVLKHKDYNARTNENDIAILDIAQDMDVQPIKMGRCSEGATAITCGWGAVREGAGTAQTLSCVGVPVISNSKCQSQYGRHYKIADGMLCAGHAQGGKDACQGDSGGPLVSEDRQTLCGVVSWGVGCARPNTPGVYARTENYQSWIRTAMNS